MNDKITLPRAVLEQALEALQMMGVPSPLVFLPDEIKCWQSAQAALRAALKQPKGDQEPYLWYDPETGATWTNEALADGYTTEGLIPLHEAPQPRQTLSEEVIYDIWRAEYTTWIGAERFMHIFQAAEAAHGIKEQK